MRVESTAAVREGLCKCEGAAEEQLLKHIAGCLFWSGKQAG